MIYIFDLDLTIWECFNKNNDPIWAKQMVPPFKLNDGYITDDVHSKCFLRKCIDQQLLKLNQENHKIGFLSVGAYHDLPYEIQPSILLLKKFNLYPYFNYIKKLEYKTFDKASVIKNIKEPLVLYDDNVNVLKSVQKFDNVTAVDATKISNWDDYEKND
tara:strand:+ start:1066 stop:1542 length:477 start_codon:yes stop_codon:yes gene_type:complete